MSADILPNRANNASLKELLINKRLKNAKIQSTQNYLGPT